MDKIMVWVRANERKVLGWGMTLFGAGLIVAGALAMFSG